MNHANNVFEMLTIDKVKSKTLETATDHDDMTSLGTQTHILIHPPNQSDHSKSGAKSGELQFKSNNNILWYSYDWDHSRFCNRWRLIKIGWPDVSVDRALTLIPMFFTISMLYTTISTLSSYSCLHYFRA